MENPFYEICEIIKERNIKEEEKKEIFFLIKSKDRQDVSDYHEEKRKIKIVSELLNQGNLTKE